jgi:ABC-2 type transport system ATP-binding protein
MQAIQIKNLSKLYSNKFKALDDLHLTVEPGQFFGFLGPNGAGKTTTIGVITGLANYQSGQVKVFGKDVRMDYRETRAMIGLVPQEFNFDPFLSAEQILTYEAGYFGIPHREGKKRAEEWLKFFDLWEKRKDGYKRLSGGMKRRLLIARALMHDPKILILDEPTAGVDLELRYLLWNFLKDLNSKGKTIFLTTHYIEEAEKLCTHVGVVHQGRVVAQDSVEQLIHGLHAEFVDLDLKTPIYEFPKTAGDNVQLLLADGGRRLSFQEKPGIVNEVLKMLHAKGIEIEKVGVRTPTLEDAFLTLTAKVNAKSQPGTSGVITTEGSDK